MNTTDGWSVGEILFLKLLSHFLSILSESYLPCSLWACSCACARPSQQVLE